MILMLMLLLSPFIAFSPNIMIARFAIVIDNTSVVRTCVCVFSMSFLKHHAYSAFLFLWVLLLPAIL